METASVATPLSSKNTTTSRSQQFWRAQVLVKWTAEGKQEWQQWDWSVWSEVEEVWSAMGEWDLILWVSVSTPDELETFVHQKLGQQPWVDSTKSSWNKQLYNKE